MKVVVLVTALALFAPVAHAGQAARQRPAAQAQTADKIGDAYDQFLLGRHLEEEDNIDGAVAAFKRAMELDPSAAEVPAELAALYMRQNKAEEAIGTAEAALKIDAANREANRVLGLVFAALADAGNTEAPRQGGEDYVAKATEHLEKALERPIADSDPNLRAALARMYIRAESFDKAIPLLTELVGQEPGWREGPSLLIEAFAGAGRNEDAIAWLKDAAAEDPQLYATLADLYDKQHQPKEAAQAYAKALERSPRSAELKTRYAAALLNSGGRPDAGKAKDALSDVLTARPNDVRALYLLSQAERRLGDLAGAEASARKVIAQNPRTPWGYYALAEALEERRQYSAVIDALTQPINDFRARQGGDSLDLTLLLPHLAFAYQELGQYDKAIEAFAELHKLAPQDANVSGYLIQAYISAKQYPAALALATQARTSQPHDLRLARLEAQALRQSGQADRGIAVLEDALKQHADEPAAYLALAQIYSDADRGAQAVKVLHDAEAKFPADSSVIFELGAVYDKQKKFADAEAAFRRVLEREPENAPALNYLGYMLADRGERLDESVAFLKKALQIEPDNGSYLDSLGWAYFKEARLDLAEDHLKRAADQLQTNSVVQDHYGDLLFKLGRFDEAISAWNRALAGDGDSINRGDIDKKIRSARQKLGKK